MTSSWKRVQVSEVCELIVDCVNKTAPRIDESSEYKMLRTPNIKDGKVDRSDCRFVSRDTYEKWTRRAKVLRGDVLLTREAPMGQVGLVDFDDTVFLGQRIMQYRADTSKILPEFLLYSFLSSDLQNQFKAHDGSGSVVSHIRVPDCSKFEIWLPPIVEQEFIVKQLRTLDLKISVNSNLNALLENIAQAIFKNWFVDFEPTKAKIAAREALLAETPAATPEQIATAEQQAAIQAIAGAGDIIPTEQLQTIADLFPSRFVESELSEIPEGWEVGCLADLIEFNPKRTLKKGTVSPYLDMKNVPVSGHLAEDVVLKEMKSGTKFINGDTLLARITPCLENGKTAYVDFLDEGQVGWGSTEFIVMRPKGNIHTSIAYLIARQATFRSIAIQTMTGTSGRQRADAKAIATKKWVIYPEVLLEKFSQITSSFMALSKANGDQNKSLSSMRDSLLPKLLTGEISVQQAELES